MMNLKSLSSKELLTNTKSLVAKEREVTSQILWHLREIEARRLFAELGFSSLFDYAVRDLGYSESSANRRISAMRLLKELPQMEQALVEGKLTLSHLSSAQQFFRQERKCEGKSYSAAEKLDLLQSLQGTSQRETEKILVSLSPESLQSRHERVRPITESHSEFKTVISDEILKKLERVRELAAHRLASGTWAEVLELMAEQTIKALDPVRQPKRDAVKARRSASPAPEVEGSKAVYSSKGRYIPKALKKSVFERAAGQCEYTHEGRRCSCRNFLQVDHIVPLGQGGSTSEENIRVLCHAHNQWAAMQSYGRKKMEGFWART
jgi:5-methylcytosine-specific restriction endonuclease McrA